jgi:hypothetical protein
VKMSDEIIGTSFDILSLEALFLVPRYVLLMVIQFNWTCPI